MSYQLSHSFVRGENDLVIGHEVRATNKAVKGISLVLFKSDDGKRWTPIVLGANAPLGVVKYVLRLRKDTDLKKLMTEIDALVMEAWRDEKSKLEGMLCA